MKKIFMVFLSVLLIGCSGSGGNKGSKYTYKWGPAVGGFSTSSLGFISLNESEGEEPPAPVYSGTAVPPYATVKYLTDKTNSGIGIFTYFNGVPVRSNYYCDPNDGAMFVTGVNNDIDVFRPKKTGILYVTATYNEYTLTIPVHVYWAYTFDTLLYIDFDTMTIYPDGDDPAVDVLLGGTNLKAPYGYQAISHDALSTITTAPDGFYRQLPFDQEYWAMYYDNISNGAIIKTDEGRYVKMRFMSWGYGGVTFCFWVSDINGVFSH